MVTGSPFMISNSSTKSARCIGSSFDKRGAARLLVLGEDHLAHGADAGLLEEHVLGAAQPDAFGAELDRGARILRRIGIDAHAESCAPDRPSPSACRIRRTVSGSIIGMRPASTWPSEPSMVMTSPVLKVRDPEAHGAAAIVDADRAATGDAGLAHAARHHRGVRGHAAARGQDALGRVHAVNVFRRGLDAHQNDLAAVGLQLGGFIGGEHDLAGGSAGRSRQAGCDHVTLGVRDRWSDAAADRAKRDRCARPHPSCVIRPSLASSTAMLQRGLGRALAAAGLQHPQFAAARP